MEESSLIALFVQTVGQSTDIIDRIGRQEEGLYEHGDGREDRWHTINRLTPIAIAMGEGQRAIGQEGGCEGCVTFVAWHMAVIGANILSTKALDDNHHHILFLEGRVALTTSVDR